MSSTIERLPVQKASERVAVLLNANARSVSERLRRELEQFVPTDDLFYSRSFDDARSIARTVLSRGYRTVLTGGGDGTFVGFANCILDAAEAPEGIAVGRSGSALKLDPARAPVPRFGVLKLGTGNAVAGMAGASGRRVGVVEDILRARSGELAGVQQIHLLSVDGKRAPFAGCGIDAKLLNDYVDLKTKLSGGALAFAGQGGLGYFCSVAAKTLPHYLFQRGVSEIEVVNLGRGAVQLGPDGTPIGREIGHGEIIYKGACKMAAAGTVPYYGFGFTMFPHALRSPGRFQLRLTAIGVPKILANLRSLWRGGPPPSGVHDFHCEKVLIRFDREMPLQVGGDAEGYRREVTLEMVERPLELIDFH